MTRYSYDRVKLSAQLEMLILGLPWNAPAPSNADAIPAASVKPLLAHDMARTLLVEGLSNRPHKGTIQNTSDRPRKLRPQSLRAKEIRALQSIAQGRITSTVRSKLIGGIVPGAALVAKYVDLGYTDAAIKKAAAVVASEAKTIRHSGRQADNQALNITRRCRQIYEMATGRPGNLIASENHKTGQRRYVGLHPFVIAVFKALRIDANAATYIKAIENERRAGTKTRDSIELASPNPSASIRRNGARLPRAA